VTSVSTRERILEAASTEFAERGFAGATTRGIATRAGVNEVTLFRHFGNKQELFAAVLGRGAQARALIQKTVEALYELPPREALFQAGLQQLVGLEQNLPWLRLQIIEPGTGPTGMKVPGFRYRSTIAGYIREWQRRGVLRADLDPDIAGESFAVGIFGFVLANKVVFPSDSPPTREAFVRQFVDIFLTGMENH